MIMAMSEDGSSRNFKSMVGGAGLRGLQRTEVRGTITMITSLSFIAAWGIGGGPLFVGRASQSCGRIELNSRGTMCSKTATDNRSMEKKDYQRLDVGNWLHYRLARPLSSVYPDTCCAPALSKDKPTSLFGLHWLV